MQRLFITTLGFLILSMPCWALVGTLPKKLKEKNDAMTWGLTLPNPLAQDVVDGLNNYDPIKIILDPNLSKVKIKTFKMDGFTVLQGAEKLAGMLGATTYVYQEKKLYISKTPPTGADAGGAAGGGGAGGGGTKGGNDGNKPGTAQGSKVPQSPGKFVPGSDTTHPWSEKSHMACKKDDRAILLYIYDEKLKVNELAYEIESKILRDPKVKAALSGFTFVRIKATSKAWPPSVVAPGKKGAALYILDAQGNQHGRWSPKTYKPNAEALLKAITRASKSTDSYLKLKGKFKPKTKNPKKGGNDLIAKKEEPPKKPTIPGLDGKMGESKKEKKKRIDEEE